MFVTARRKGRIETHDQWIDLFCFDLRISDDLKICQFPSLVFCLFIVIFILSRGYIHRRSLRGSRSPWAFVFIGWLIWAIARIGMSWTHCDVEAENREDREAFGTLWDLAWLLKNVGEGMATIYAILALRHDLGWMSWPNARWCRVATFILLIIVGFFVHSIFIKKKQSGLEREILTYVFETLSIIVNIYMIYFCHVNSCFTNRVGKALVMITLLNVADAVFVYAHIPISPCLGYLLQVIEIVLAWSYVYWTRRMLKGVDDISESMIEEVDDIINSAGERDLWDSPLGRSKLSPIQTRLPQLRATWNQTLHSELSPNSEVIWNQTI